jgi:hypothetical protein
MRTVAKLRSRIERLGFEVRLEPKAAQSLGPPT